MKKCIVRMVDTSIILLCFIFLLFSFFKIVSFTVIDTYMCTSIEVMICIWILGILTAVVFTRPLYRWILHFRSKISR